MTRHDHSQEGFFVWIPSEPGRKYHCASPVPRVHVRWAVALGLARFGQPCIRARQRRGVLAGA